MKHILFFRSFAVLTLALILLPLEAFSSAASSEARKATTEKYLRDKGIPINANLPLIESSKDAKFRSAQDVARRAIILYHISAFGYGIEGKKVIEALNKSGVSGYLSPSEEKLIKASNPTQQQIINAKWRVEALWVLLWALGKVDTLEFPAVMCEPQNIHKLIPKPKQAQAFIVSATLRNQESILDETDKIYRIHWAVRDAQLNGKAIPGNLNSGVVLERHYALNWLTMYLGVEWDDVSTDT